MQTITFQVLIIFAVLCISTSVGIFSASPGRKSPDQALRLRGSEQEQAAPALPFFVENGTFSHDEFVNSLGALSKNLTDFHINASLRASISSNSSIGKNEPKLFFLFLTMSGIKRPELWRAFFNLESKTRYRVLMHCKHKHVCALQLASSNALGASQVDTVPSEYCKDLVSPMVQLLHFALLESTSPRDKFIFLSESTLPVKPFWHVYNTLTWDQNSDFCIYPTDHWVKLHLAANMQATIVKHSQWVVLNQAHASSMVHAWASVKAMLEQPAWSIPVFSDRRAGPWGQITNPSGQLALPMCLDEWAFFGTIYGAFIDKGELSKNNLPGLSATPLHFRGNPDLDTHTQGVCRTFAFWDAAEVGASKAIEEIAKDYPWSKLSCYPKCSTTHPAEFTALSDRGVAALRRSRFLFARKFQDQVISMDQFQRIILAAGSPATL